MQSILLIAATVIVLITAAAGAYFTACHDSIYDTIMSEVELEKSGLGGDIMKIVRYKDKLFVANGNIYMKTAQPSRVTGLYNGQWKKVASNIMGDGDNNIPSMTYFLAADANYLYALVYKWKEDNDGINTIGEVGVYASQDYGSTWEAVEKPSGVSSYNFVKEEAQTIIFDNQVIPDEQKTKLDLNANPKTGYIENPDNLSTGTLTAYIRIKGHGVYKLNGTSAPSETVTIEQVTGTIGSDTGKEITGLYKEGSTESTTGRDNVFSAYCVNGTDYFTSYYGLSGNKYGVYYSGSYTTKDSDGDHYVSGSSYVYFFDGTTRTSVGVTQGSVYSTTVTSDYLLLGTHNGMTRIKLGENGALGDETGLPKNGDSIITENVFMVFAQDPTASYGNNDLYAASQIYGSITSSSDSWSDVGLYAKYPGRQDGTWNRDGSS